MSTPRRLTIPFDRPDKCPKCGEDYSLEIYDYFNYPMGLRRIIDIFMNSDRLPKDLINKKPFYTIRCRKCGQCYPIKWVHGFPLPDFGTTDIGTFLREFKYQGK